jgi:transposase-like protein
MPKRRTLTTKLREYDRGPAGNLNLVGNKPVGRAGNPDGRMRLDIRHKKAISLRLQGMKVKEVGEKLGVNESTIYKWFQDPEIKRLYNDYKEMMLEDAEAQLVLDWEKLTGRMKDISLESEDERASILAFKELRLTLGRGTKADIQVDVKGQHAGSSGAFPNFCDQ